MRTMSEMMTMEGAWVGVRDGVLHMKGQPYGQSVSLAVDEPERLARTLRGTVEERVEAVCVFDGDGGLVTVSPWCDELMGLCVRVAMVGDGQVRAILTHDEAYELAAMLEGQ